jgi:hypothetical protein
VAVFDGDGDIDDTTEEREVTTGEYKREEGKPREVMYVFASKYLCLLILK